MTERPGMTDGPGRFDEPWQADLFALTVALSDAGHLPWRDWTQALGATLADHGAARPIEGGADYHLAWLDTLEALLVARGLAAPDEARALKAAWAEAYLATPHGRPVRLAR